MRMRYIAALAAGMCALTCVSCKSSKGAKLSVSEDGNSLSVPAADENGNPTVGDIVIPAEDSEEYSLGEYRVSSRGVKLYYDDEISKELALALEEFFLTFANDDFETYKTCLFPDYAERYDAFLQKEYQYSLDTSFQNNREKLCSIFANEIKEHDGEDTESEPSGEFKIARIKVQRPNLGETTYSDLAMEQEDTTEPTTMSLEEFNKQAFSYLDDVFEMDYYSFVKENSDKLESVNFYIYASDENGNEYPLIGDVDIVFAVKDGKYYTFG